MLAQPQSLDSSNCVLINRENCQDMWPSIVLAAVINRLDKILGPHATTKIVEGIKKVICEGKTLSAKEILPRIAKRYGRSDFEPTSYGEVPDIDYEALASDIFNGG